MSTTSNSLLLGKTNGVCVNSIITDKIREYMMSDSPSPATPTELSNIVKENASVIHERKKASPTAQDPVSTSDLALPSSLNVSIHNSGDPCPHKQDLVTASIRRIGNSLDALLNESKNASQVKAVKKVVPQQPPSTDRLFLSSEQIRYKKSVTLHDICEEYIQFITVNSPDASPADEEVVTTTSESETPDRRQRAASTNLAAAAVEPELQIIRLPVIPPPPPAGNVDLVSPPKLSSNRTSVPAVIPKKRTAQISVITVNENLSKNKTARKRSIEDPPVATETECEKSNGATDDQTTTECKIALDKKEESVTTVTATTPDDTVDENVISNGIKSTTPPLEVEKEDIEQQQEEKEDEKIPTKIESADSAVKEAEHPTVGANNDAVDPHQTAPTETSSPLRNGLIHEDAEKNGSAVDEDIGEAHDAHEDAVEKMEDEVAAPAEAKQPSDLEADDEQSMKDSLPAEEAADSESTSTMEVDESAPAAAAAEPMDTSSAVDDECSPTTDEQTAVKPDDDQVMTETAKAAAASENSSTTSSRSENESESKKKDDELSPSSADSADDRLSTAANESSTDEKKNTTTTSPAALAPSEQDAKSASSSNKAEKEREEVREQAATDSASSPAPAPVETICDKKSVSSDSVSVKTEERVAETTNADEEKSRVEQISDPSSESKEVQIKEEVIPSDVTAPLVTAVESTDLSSSPAPTSVPSSAPSNNASAAPSISAATTVPKGTKRRAETASEDLEADRDGRISSSSSDAENNQDHKRIRFDESIFEEDERERLIREFVERSTESSNEIGKNCDKLQHEIAALTDLARSKELEWNSIIRLLKLKEEMLERVLFKKRSLDCQSKNDSDTVSLSKLYKSIASPAEQTKANRNESNVPTCISSQVTVVPISSSTNVTAGASGSQSANAAANAHDAATGGKSAAAAFVSSPFPDKLRAPHRPILPKPPTAAAAAAAAAAASVTLQATTSATPQSSSSLSQSAATVTTVLPTSHTLPPPSQPTTLPQALLSANAAAAAAAANNLLIDQNSVIGEGRQGPIVDVKSIIAEYRSKNPESSPRRGRRNVQFTPRTPDSLGNPRYLPNNALLSMASMALGSGSHVRANVSSTTHSGEHVRYLGQDGTISAAALNRPDLQIRQANMLDSFMLSINASNAGNSSQSNAGNAAAAMVSGSGGVSMTSASTSNASGGGGGAGNNTSFQDALVKFAKMNEKRDMVASSNAHLAAQKNASHLLPPPPYPEVTLHPVLVPQFPNSPQNSLLHGILTKSSSGPNRGGPGSGGGVGSAGGSNSGPNVSAGMVGAGGDHHPSSSMNSPSVSNLQHRPTNFSPTLARLLTAPERNRGSRANVSGSASRNTKSTLSEILNSKKTRTEVTITPVTTSATSLMKNGSDVVMDDDDESESADRLVIDEGREAVADPTSNVIPADQVPECQGCHKKAAQFVCAGCGNQWYCSRECQVQAWEEHSEMCSG